MPLSNLGLLGPDRKWHGGGDLDHAKPMGLQLEKAGLPVRKVEEQTMKISDEQIQILLRTPSVESSEAVPSLDDDRELIEQVKQAVMAMPDREEMIASLRAAIEAGEYNPTANEIAEAMIRRAIADRIQ